MIDCQTNLLTVFPVNNFTTSSPSKLFNTHALKMNKIIILSPDNYIFFMSSFLKRYKFPFTFDKTKYH